MLGGCCPRLGVETYFGKCEVAIVDQQQVWLFGSSEFFDFGECTGDIDGNEVATNERSVLQVI